MLRFCFGLLLIATLAMPSFAADAVKPKPLKKSDRIVFLGDSITAAGNRGDGYVNVVRNTLAKKADLGIEVVGAGISGHKVPDCQKRLQRDVLSKKPTIVVIYIGINDVWHSKRGKGTSKEDFDAGLRDMIKKINHVGARVILCTPTVIGEKHDGTNNFDKMLDEYADISRKVAKESGSQMLDYRAEFIKYLIKNNSDNKARGVLTRDTVHLNKTGNAFMANLVLEALGEKKVEAKK
jgi:lysophospholipase L1-like esterase